MKNKQITIVITVYKILQCKCNYVIGKIIYNTNTLYIDKVYNMNFGIFCVEHFIGDILDIAIIVFDIYQIKKITALNI